jgi:hypothetical protein
MWRTSRRRYRQRSPWALIQCLRATHIVVPGEQGRRTFSTIAPMKTAQMKTAASEMAAIEPKKSRAAI